MKSLERRFIIMKEKYVYHSSMIHFCYAIKWQKFSTEMISKWFTKLVDKDDYQQSDRKDLIKHFVWLTNLEKPLRTPDFGV